MRFLAYAGVVLAAVILLSAGYVLIARIRFDARVSDLRDTLVASHRNATPAASLALPDIVRAFAVGNGGKEGASHLFHARHQAMLTTAKGARPIPLTADQWTGILLPGIVWRADGSMNGLPVTVFDAYVEGRGELSAMLLGAFRVAGGAGPDYDKGELMRYLSELPVYPDAILNNAALTWRQIDPTTVEVTGTSPSGPASVRFIFDDNGDIVRLESDDRPMITPDGRSVPTPWHGIYASYTQSGAYRVPAYGEVGWVLDDGLFTYWHGTVIEYAPLE